MNNYSSSIIINNLETSAQADKWIKILEYVKDDIQSITINHENPDTFDVYLPILYKMSNMRAITICLTHPRRDREIEVTASFLKHLSSFINDLNFICPNMREMALSFKLDYADFIELLIDFHGNTTLEQISFGIGNFDTFAMGFPINYPAHLKGEEADENLVDNIEYAILQSCIQRIKLPLWIDLDHRLRCSEAAQTPIKDRDIPLKYKTKSAAKIS